jgi:hypothetical protein
MFMPRIVRVVVVGLACTFGLFVLLLMPALNEIIPPELREYRVEAFAAGCLIAFAITRRLAAAEGQGGKSNLWARAGLKRLDRWTDWALNGGLAYVIGLFCLGLLLAWIPHYLTWPWSRDQETFAVLAQSWDQGILPYRDIRGYNFPGAIYLAWVIGKVFGWGHSVPLYAFDAGCIVFLGAVLLTWSRKRLGGSIPGLIGYLVFLSYYLSFTYELTAERDWYTALLVCVGLLLMQTWPGRVSRLISALAAALALTIRPHAVLFLPALVWEVAQGADASTSGRRARIRWVVEWCLWWFLFVVMACTPLLLAGIADDFVRGLRVAAYGGPYSRATPGSMMGIFVEQLEEWKTYIPLVATLLWAARLRDRSSGMAQSWSLAWLGVLVYRPLHPVQHRYLLIPICLVSAITWAFAVSWLLSFPRLARPVLVLAILLMVYEIMPARPAMCDLNKSLWAVRPLLLGEIPVRTPIGCPGPYERNVKWPTRWNAYRELLIYLRRHTGPRTLIANVINQYPYDTLNGPTGRLSPFLAESGICWLIQVDIDLDPEFADSLLRATDSVVVWVPIQNRVDRHVKIKRIIAVIHQYYEPEARFGLFEVWNRRREHSP